MIIDDWIFDLLDKHLNKYYAKCTAKMLYDTLKCLDLKAKYVKTKDAYIVYIKKPKDNAKHYKEFHRTYFYNSAHDFVKLAHKDYKEICQQALKMLDD